MVFIKGGTGKVSNWFPNPLSLLRYAAVILGFTDVRVSNTIVAISPKTNHCHPSLFQINFCVCVCIHARVHACMCSCLPVFALPALRASHLHPSPFILFPAECERLRVSPCQAPWPLSPPHPPPRNSHRSLVPEAARFHLTVLGYFVLGHWGV